MRHVTQQWCCKLQQAAWLPGGRHGQPHKGQINTKTEHEQTTFGKFVDALEVVGATKISFQQSAHHSASAATVHSRCGSGANLPTAARVV
jgi:hypothetical protein